MSWEGGITYRQHNAYIAFINMEMSIPGKTESYIIQLTCVVAGMFAKTPPKMEDFKIEFQHSEASERKVMTPEERANMQRSIWMAAAGMKSDGTPIDRPEKKVIAIPRESPQEPKFPPQFTKPLRPQGI
jgi:hypothetical protein